MLMLVLNKKGVSVIATMLTIFILAAFGVGVSYFTSTNQSARVQQITSMQAFYSSQAGMEYAMRKILNDSDASTSFTIDFAGEPVVISRSGGSMTSTATEQGSRSTNTVTDPGAQDPSECLSIDSSGARINSTQLGDIDFSKNPACPGNVILTGMTGSTWAPDQAQLINQIQFGGSSVEWKGPPDQASGGNLDFQTYYQVGASGNFWLNYMRWDSDVTNTDFHLVIHCLWDNKPFTKEVNIKFLADEQASCLVWNTAAAKLNWVSNRWGSATLATAANSCSKPIRLDKMTVVWSPSTPARNMTAIDLGGSIYSGSTANGVQLDVDRVITQGGATITNGYTFDGDVLGRNYTVNWMFADGTNTTLPLEIFAADQASCLTVNTTNADIDPGNNKKIVGIRIQSTCGKDVGMTGITMSWDVVTMQFTGIQTNDNYGVRTFTATSNNGVLTSFGATPLYLRNEDGSKNITYLLFSQPIASVNQFTLAFQMADGTTKSVSFKP